ncbi:putative transmembrane protein [Cryptosporidium felis]|nr:putative transmembrane protein [Cryptosporidium felis]
MSRRKVNAGSSKANTSQSIQLLIVWTIFLGLLILVFQLIYKYIIKKLAGYILSLLGLNNSRTVNVIDNEHSNANIQDATQTRRRKTSLNQLSGDRGSIFEDSVFRVSFAFCFDKEKENIQKIKVLNSLIKLSRLTGLFLFIQVNQTQDEEFITDCLEKNNVFNSGLKKHRVVFCEKKESIPCMARQLQANMHIDTNTENIRALENKVPNVSVIDLNDDGSMFEKLVETIENVVTD